MATLTSEQQRELAQSMLMDQNECLTVASLVTALHISRTGASQLLTELSSSSETQHQATAIVSSSTTVNCQNKSHDTAEPKQVETVPCTVFSFKKCNAPASQEDDSSFLYAIAPQSHATTSDGATSNESAVSSSHEKALGQWRDMIRKRDAEQLQACAQPAQDILQSAESQEELETRWERYLRPSTDLGAATVSHTTASNSLAFKKKKAVGAAAYFGAKSKSGDTKTSSAKSKPGESTASSAKSKIRDPNAFSSTKSKAKKSKTSSSSSTSQTKQQSKPLKASSSSSIVASMRKASELAQEEKENANKQIARKKSEEKKSVGNADDFVGDMDDEDDEDSYQAAPEHEVENPASKESSAHGKDSSRPPKDEEENVISIQDEEDDESEANVEPMEIEQPKPRRRARRKKLVQKTSVDEKGYFHTEMQEIWEEVPSDEETEKPKASAAPASKISAPRFKASANEKKVPPKKKAGKAKGMKQGSLHSFFKK